MESKLNKLAIFDFDGTITNKDSFNCFLIHRFGYLKFYLGFFLNSPYIALYLLKKMSNANMKSKLFSYFYKNKTYQEYVKDCQDFANNGLDEIIRDDILEIIKNHKNDSTELVILSASFEEWILPWSEKYGFDYVICSKFLVKNNIIDGKICEKDSCYGKNKVQFLKDTIKNIDDFYIYAYGDSASDKYFMELADEQNWIK